VLLGLTTAALVLGALLWEVSRPKLMASYTRLREWARARARERRMVTEIVRARALDHDPGREHRAEQRARKLLRSCVEAHEWAMYRDLGFLRVWGGAGEGQAYLIYPHQPIVSYAPQTGTPLGEHCVAFPDRSSLNENTCLPDADDVLAKWMALQADEHALLARANTHLPGRQVDLRMVRSDLRRLAAWERERKSVNVGRLESLHGHGGLSADSVPNRVTLATETGGDSLTEAGGHSLTEAGRHSLTEAGGHSLALASPFRSASPVRPASPVRSASLFRPASPNRPAA
jgi:hypothetical protein